MVEAAAGWRQRKKQKTRRALADAATRLFTERGYEETTIADLAVAAEIAPRTFFSYFPAKEDVLFADLDDRIAALSEFQLRRPGERLQDGLRRVAGEVVDSVMWDTESEGAQARMRIIGSRPSLQAAALLRLRAAERVLASRLHAAYPKELGPIEAAVVVGAFMSALRSAADGRPGGRTSPKEAKKVVERVRQILERGLGEN